MDGSIHLTDQERKTLLEVVRNATEVRRALALLWLEAGHTWAVITVMLYCGSATLARWKDWYECDGLPGLLSERRGRVPWSARFRDRVARWALKFTPRDFGFLRSRWTCALLALVLWRFTGLSVGRETIRRWLHQEQLVWRRPRPVLGPVDPQRSEKLARIRRLLEHLPDSEVAVFQDEVDVNTNPKIGAMWMRRGQQAAVVTPGTNHKAYVAGSLNWRTGRMITTAGPRRNRWLFLEHLADLCWHLRRYRVIHVICDNAAFHKSPDVQRWLAAHPRVRLHFLPTYAPDTNPIERVWWHLHESVTRNHRCRSLAELLHQVFTWLDQQTPHAIETSTYPLAHAA